MAGHLHHIVACHMHPFGERTHNDLDAAKRQSAQGDVISGLHCVLHTGSFAADDLSADRACLA